MKKSNFLKVSISVGSAIVAIQAVQADTNTITSKPKSQPTSSAPALGAAWSAPVANTLPTLQTVMHNPFPTPTATTPSKTAGPAGSINILTNLMCGDTDVANFAAGVNPSACSQSKNVQFINPGANGSHPTAELVLGYWVTLASNATAAKPGAAVVPGQPGSAFATWYPLAYLDKMSVDAKTKVSSLSAVNKTNKTGGNTDIGNMIFNKANSIVASLGNGSYGMKGSTTKYAAYFGLMACNQLDDTQGIKSGSDLPDSLEITDFQAWLNSSKGIAAMGTCTPGNCVVSYTAPSSPTTASSAGSPSLIVGAPSGGAGGTSWNVNIGSGANGNALYNLGATIGASTFTGLASLSAAQTALLTAVNNSMGSGTCGGAGFTGESQRWYEPFAMNTTCGVLDAAGGYKAAYAAAQGGNFTALSTLLMNAGIAQEAQNVVANKVQQPTVRCFHPGEEYIDQVLASIVFPFTTKGANLIALAPGVMTHPEALFADIKYASSYCTLAGVSPACAGQDFNTVFGMTAIASPAVLAQNSGGVFRNLADLAVPNAQAMALMLEGGVDEADALDTLGKGTGMIKSGVPVPTATYAASLVGDPDAQALANAAMGIPVIAGSTSNVATPMAETTFIPNGIGLTINFRANGSGSNCPVSYCKADEEPTSSKLE